MGQKWILEPYVFQTTSLAASFTSEATSIKRFDRCLLQIVCAGTPAGTLTVQGSADNITFVELPLSLTVLAGSAQNYFVDIQQTAIAWLRLKYVRTSGTGTIAATITAKES
jgi:hypothetical protein